LGRSLDELWFAVCELVVTVHEDRPAGSDLAVVDDLAERVSELQADVHAARRAAAEPSSTVPQGFDAIGIHLARAGTRYWRDFRAHAPVAHLRAAARSRGVEWQAWRGSVEEAVERIESPLAGATAELRAGWHEVAELLRLGAAPLVVPDLDNRTASPGATTLPHEQPHEFDPVRSAPRDQSRRSS